MMTLTPIQHSLVALYNPLYLVNGEFAGDDNDLAIVVSHACNRIADSGHVAVAFQTFLACTPRNCLPPIEHMNVVKADYDERASKAAAQNPEVVDFILDGDIFNAALTYSPQFVEDNHVSSRSHSDEGDARLAAAAAVRAWVTGELTFLREQGAVRALSSNPTTFEAALLQNAKAISFLLMVIQHENEIGRQTLAQQEALKALFSLLNGPKK